MLLDENSSKNLTEGELQREFYAEFRTPTRVQVIWINFTSTWS